VITTDWLKENHTMIHYFGLGFIQIKINEDKRFHFYNDKLPSIMPEEEVHNHRYGFRSEILAGTLTEKLYIPIDGEGWNMISVSCDPDKPAPKDKKQCGIKEIHNQTYTAGSTYYIEMDTFHKVYGMNCITKLHRESVVKEFAQVIRADNAQEICPFSSDMSEADMWALVDDMIKRSKNE